MRRPWLSAAAALALALGASGAASAGQVVYSSGSFSGTKTPWRVSEDYEVSTKFTLSGTEQIDLSSAEVLLWVSTGQTPTSLAWRIGTTEFGSETAASSGPTSLSNTAVTPYPAGYATFASTFAMGGARLDPGTVYWLTLSNALASGAGSVFWGDNGGSSEGKVKQNGNVFNNITRVAFQLYGETVDPPTPAVPEPASLTLLGLGAGCGLLVYRRRKGASV